MTDVKENSSHQSNMGALQTKTSQVWVHATLWHATRSSRRLPIAVLVDTGAGGGSYVSRQFIESMEERDGWGKSLINPTGKGLLSAANPKISAVPPMEVVDSCLLPLVFVPVGQIFRVKFRVVRGPPCAMVLGAAFMKDNRSILSFDGEEGFRPTPSSAWIPFAPKEVEEAAAGAMCAEWDHYCAVKPSTDEQEPEELEGPKIPAGIMELGNSVWENALQKT